MGIILNFNEPGFDIIFISNYCKLCIWALIPTQKAFMWEIISRFYRFLCIITISINTQ